ncbi:flavodoxin family protein [Peristeroidobacter soli]|jgi:hypothetical protein|uniref:flavodoxin family protein n=1 Tax=Peristeroidobacter soli TaxID=2497877 RepID=UPI00158E1B25|nr:flavodoxin [Peristeroidobacter soli]
MDATKRVLVVYYSLSGNTARVARDLATRLGADIESIRDLSHGAGGLSKVSAAFDAWRKAPAKIGTPQLDPARYPLMIVGTPVWMWRMTPAIRGYLNRMSDRIHSVAFFVTSGDTDVGKLQPALEVAAGHRAVAAAGFNAKELADAVAYETKLATFVDEITHSSGSPRRAA